MLFMYHFSALSLKQIYTSTKSRTTRSSAIIALWPYLSGILTSRRPTMEDIRVGIIEKFLLHTPEIKQTNGDNSRIIMQQPHVLASVKCYQDHPQKYYFGNGIATVPENTSCSSYIPVSRILSKCSYIHTKVKFSYREDNVCVAIPLKRHNLF